MNKKHLTYLLIAALLIFIGGAFIGKAFFSKTEYKQDLKKEEALRAQYEREIQSLKAREVILTDESNRLAKKNDSLLKVSREQWVEATADINRKKDEEINLIRSTDSTYLRILSE